MAMVEEKNTATTDVSPVVRLLHELLIRHVDGAEKRLDQRIEYTQSNLSDKILNVDVSLRQHIDASVLRLEDKIDSVETSLTAKINSVDTKLSTKIDSVETSLTEKIHSVEASLTAKIDAVDARLAALEARLRFNATLVVASVSAVASLCSIVLTLLR